MTTGTTPTGALPLHVHPAAGLPAAAAERLAALLRTALHRAPRASLAVSGGSTPAATLGALAAAELAWDRVDVVQVDERVAPDGDPDRNLLTLTTTLGATAARIHPVPVGAPDAERAAHAATVTLHRVAPLGLDVVQLGLGDDGHTASLVPGDASLLVERDGYSATAEYRGRRRVTLTLPALARARSVLWLVTGEAKADMVRRLQAADPTIPAGLVRRDRAEIWADPAAAAAAGAAAARP